jgi:prefoldin subunit 5
MGDWVDRLDAIHARYQWHEETLEKLVTRANHLSLRADMSEIAAAKYELTLDQLEAMFEAFQQQVENIDRMLDKC